MDVLNENSNTTGLDLYDDILISEGIQKQQTNDELQQKYSEAQARITELEIELEQTKNGEKHYKQLTESVTNNLSSLLVTAKAEISRKDTIIKSLRSQIDNLKHDGGLKGALRRSHREHRCYDRVEDLYHDRPANGHDKEPSPSKTSKRESRERESDDRLRKQDSDRNRNRTESGRRKRKVLSEEEESDVQIKKSKHDYSKRASETPARSVQHFHCERSRDGFDSARKLVEKSKRQLLRRKSNDNKNEGFDVKQSESKRESSFSAAEDSFSGRTVEIVKIDRNSSKKHISVPRKTKDESSDSDAPNRKRERSRTKPKLEGRKEKDREKLDKGESSSRGKPSKPESREKDKERRPRSKKEDGQKDEEYKIDRSKTSKDGNDDNRVKEKLQSQESSPFKSIVCDDSKASRGKNGEKQSDNKVDVSNNDQSSVGGRIQQDDSLEKKSEVDDLRQKITLKRKNRQSSSSDKSSPERTKTETPSPKKRVVISPIRFFCGISEKTNTQREVTPYKDVPLTLPLICSTKSDTFSSKNALHHPDSHIETKINEIEEGVGPTKSENCTSAEDGKTKSFSNVALDNEITKKEDVTCNVHVKTEKHDGIKCEEKPFLLDTDSVELRIHVSDKEMMEFDVSLTSPQKVTKDTDKKGKKTSVQKGDDRKYHIGESRESEVKQSYQEKSKKSNQPSASCDKLLVHGVVQDAEFSDTSASFEVATDTILHTAKGRQIVMKSNCSSPKKVAEDKLNDDFTADLEFLNLVKKMHEEEKLFKSKSAPELSGKVKRSKKSKEEQKTKIKKDQVSSCEKVSTDTSLNGNSLKSEVTACVTEGIKGIRENVEKSEPEQKCVTKPLVAKTTESIKTNKRSSAFQVHESLKENINLSISSKEGLVINQIECASEKEQEEESVNGHNSSNIQHVHDVKESDIVCKSSQTEEERIPHEKKQSLSDSDNYLISGDESDIKDQSKCSDGLSQRGSVELGFDTLEELIFDTKNLEKKSLMCVDEKECDGEFKVPTCYTPTFGPPNLSDAIRLTAYAANTASPLMYNSSTSSSPGKLIINENIPSTPHSEISMEVETSETVSHCDKNGDEKLTESANDEAEECIISQSDEKEDLCSVNGIARSEGSENGVSESEGSVNDIVRSECSDNDIVRSECSDDDIVRSECSDNDVVRRECSDNGPSKSVCSDNDIVRSECPNNGIATNEFSDIGVAAGECSNNEMATSDVEGSSFMEGEVNESKQEEEKINCTGLTIKSESSSTSSDASIKLDMEKSSPKRYFKQISIDSIRNSIKSKLQEKDESIPEKLYSNKMPSVSDETPFDGDENLIKIQKDSNKVEDMHVDSLEDDLVLSDPESETDKEVRDISEQSMSNEMSYKVYEHSSVNMMELAEMSQSKSGTSVIPSSSEENDSGLSRKEKVEVELECGISPEEEGQNDYDEEFSGSCEVTSETESITEFYDEESRLDLEDIASLREHDGFRIRRQSYENQSLKVEEIDAGVNYKRRNSSASSEDEELDKSSEKFVKCSGKKCVLDIEKEDGEIASTESEQDNKDMQINKSTILENKLQVDFKLSKSPEINDEKRCVRSASIEKAQMVKDTGKSSVRERRASDDDISNSHDRKRIKISRTERDSRKRRDDPRKDTYSGSRSSARYSSERVGSSSPYSFTRSRDSRHGSDERQTREHNSRHGSDERQTREHNSPSYRVKRESRTKSSEQYSDRHRDSKYTSSRSRHESSDENNPKRDEKLKKREQITFHNSGSTSRSRPPRDRHSDTDSDYKEKQIPRKSHHDSHIQSNKSERRDTLGAKRSSVLSNLYESSESSRSYGSSSRQRSLSKKDDTDKKASVKENVSNRTRSKERVSRHASGSDRYESRSRHR